MKTEKLKVLMHLAVPLFIIGLTICVSHQAMAEQKGGVSLVSPKFEVDPFWPKPLPDNWLYHRCIKHVMILSAILTKQFPYDYKSSLHLTLSINLSDGRGVNSNSPGM